MSEDYRYSTLTLYKNCQIIPTRNFIVDGIENYLNTLTKESISEFQYLRNTLEMTIKIHKPEAFAEMILNNNYNYLKVSQNSRIYYYFILKKTQIAEETIGLDLRMDVINTFRSGNTQYGGGSFAFTSKTKVLREHKDRFKFSLYHTKIRIDGTLYGNTTLAAGDLVILNIRQFEKLCIVDDAGLEFKTLLFEDNSTLGTTHLTQNEFALIMEALDLKEDDIYFIDAEDEELSEYMPHAQLQGGNVMNKTFIPVVDLYSEGLNPVLYKEEVGELNDEDYNTWYLIYETNANATEDNPQPVNVYLAPKIACEVIDTTSVNITSSSLEAGKYYHFVRGFSTTSPEVKAEFSGGSVEYQTNSSGIDLNSFGFIIYLDPNNSGKLCLEYYRWYYNYFGVYGFELLSSWDNLTSVTLKSNAYPVISYERTSKQSDLSLVLTYTQKSFNTTSTAQNLKSFDTLDRTDSKLVKIIELPYLPIQTEVDNSGRLIFGSEWSVDGTKDFMKLNDNYISFNNDVKTAIPNPFTAVYGEKSLDISPNTTRHLKDPKLYHSDYYQPKFVYDSFGFVFQLEKMNQDREYSEQYFNFTFVMTTTIRSRFLFKFDDYDLKYATEDYEKVLSVARNNEAVLYNSPYLTYLRTGYNIDIKAKERAETTAIIGGIFGGIGAIAGTALAVGSGNPALAVKGAISGVSSFASSIVNTINTIASAEENMEKKLKTLKAQAISVEGSDDIDLLNSYSNNKAKLVLYKVSPRLEKELDNLFYYTGYVCNEMKIPNTGSRYWFNFLAAELDITGISASIPELCLTELFNKYREGVTFLHARSVSNVLTWDFAQEKENIEIGLDYSY